jgi:hypothetical protein
VQDSAADGCGAINAGDDDAEQKEHLDPERKRRGALNKPPDEDGGEKAVV